MARSAGAHGPDPVALGLAERCLLVFKNQRPWMHAHFFRGFVGQSDTENRCNAVDFQPVPEHLVPRDHPAGNAPVMNALRRHNQYRALVKHMHGDHCGNAGKRNQQNPVDHAANAHDQRQCLQGYRDQGCGQPASHHRAVQWRTEYASFICHFAHSFQAPVSSKKRSCRGCRRNNQAKHDLAC